jgi:hypothetical protein
MMRGVDDVFETRGREGLTKGVGLSRSHQITQKCKGAPCSPGKAIAYGSHAHGRVGAPVSFQFANEGETRCELTNTAAAVGEDGWAQIAPFGDFPGMVTEVLPGGGVKGKPAPAIQRMDRTAAEAMVAHFNSATSRIMRWLRGVPIFSGHPDFPGTGNRYPDKGHKGVIAQLQVRNDGLYALPVFNGDGQALIQSQPGLGFSARWTAEPVEVVNGVHVLRPTQLISAGLTTQPNLPVQLINETYMDLTALIAALKRMGVTIAEGADLAAIVAAITAAADKADADKAAATTQAANERAALTTAQGEVSRLTGLLTQRTTEHATTIINEAIRSGRATEAERATLASQFANDFNGAAAALTARAATQLKTASAAGHVQPGTGAAASNMQERQHQALQLINAKVSEGMPYNQAFDAVKKARPELFGAK